MKKIFALALAAVMTAGMTTVAFAAKSDANPAFAATNGNKFFAVDFNDNGVFESSVEGDDKAEVYNIDQLGSLELKGGEKVALYIYNYNSTNLIEEKDDLDRFKVTAKWEEGKLDEKPSIEKIKTDDYGYVYAVTFTLPEAPATKTADLIGTVTLYKNTQQKDDANFQFNFNATIGVSAVDYDDQDLADARVIDFSDYDDVAYLTFGTDFEFEVDVENQGKLNLKNNRKYNAEFAAMYDYANIDFITFENTPSSTRSVLPTSMPTRMPTSTR